MAFTKNESSGVTIKSHELQIKEQEWNEALVLLQSLIRCYPVYASNGLRQAQLEIVAFMQKNQWPVVIQDKFADQDIDCLDGYVNVHSFGSIYQDYKMVPKTNVYGIIDSGKPGPTLILNGHVDVDFASTPDQWSFEEGWRSARMINGRLYGRGSTDMLSGLAALIAAANCFNARKELWRGRIIVTAVTDEEIGGNGTLRALDWLDTQRLLTKETVCLIAEPSNQKVCLRSLGFSHLLLTFHAFPVHMGVANPKKNALSEALQLIQEFERILQHAAAKIEPLIDNNCLKWNFGIIQGGMDSAIPMSLLKLEGTLFFPARLDEDSFKKSLQKTIQSKFENVEIEFSDFHFRGADFDDTSFYHQLKKHAGSSCNIFPSPCDARLFKRYGIPTVIYGPGNLEQAHAVDESICLEELEKYIHNLVESFAEYLK